MPFDLEKDYYAILGVSSDASQDEIKEAFRMRAKDIHPDMRQHDPDAHQKMLLLNEAKEVLLNPTYRAQYDANRRQSFYREPAYRAKAPQSGSFYQSIKWDILTFRKAIAMSGGILVAFMIGALLQAMATPLNQMAVKVDKVGQELNTINLPTIKLPAVAPAAPSISGLTSPLSSTAISCSGSLPTRLAGHTQALVIQDVALLLEPNQGQNYDINWGKVGNVVEITGQPQCGKPFGYAELLLYPVRLQNNMTGWLPESGTAAEGGLIYNLAP